MKVLYLTPGVFDKGGISRYNRYQIRAIREAFGKESIRVLSLRGKGTTRFEFEDNFKVFDSFGKFSFKNQLNFSLSALKQALIWRPDVVMTAHVNFSLLGVHATRLARANSLLNVYGLELWNNLKKYRRLGLEKHARIISDCYNTKDYVRDKLNFKKKIDVVWDPVDLSRYSPAEKKIELFEKHSIPFQNGEKFMLSLCRLSRGARHKGVERNIYTLLKIANPKIHYLIAGDGDDRPRLQQIAKKLNLNERVHFLGSISEDEMVDTYRLGDVFILISDVGVGRGEGIPMTPMEAGACGLPILVGNQDGSRELIENGVGGMVLNPFELDKTAFEITRILENSSLYKKMSYEIVERINSKFSFDRFAQETKNILEDYL